MRLLKGTLRIALGKSGEMTGAGSVPVGHSMQKHSHW